MGIFDNLFKKKKDASNQEELQSVMTPKHESIADPETALLLLALKIENQTCPTQFNQSEFMETFAEDFPSWSKRVFAEKISDTLPKTNRTDLIQASYQAIMNLPFERRKSALLSPCFYNCQSKYQSGLKHLRSCVDSFCVSAFKLSEQSEYNRFIEEKNEEVMEAVRDALNQHNPDFIDYHKAKAFLRIDKDPKGSDADQFLLRKTKDGTYEGVNLKLQGMMKVAVWNSMLDYWKIQPEDAWLAAENNMAPDVKETKLKEKKDIIVERSISAGYSHVLAITELGHVLTAGSPPVKQDDFGINTWRDIAAVCAGGGDDDGNTFSVGLDFQGRVHVVNDQVVKYDQVSNWRNVVSISAGSDFVIGLKKDGTLYAVGKNNEKQCDVKSWKNVVKIAAGDNYTLGLTDNGTILFTGNDLYSPSEATKWIDIVDISAAQTYVIGLKKDGTAVTTSGTSYLSKPCDVSTWKDLIMVSAGATYVVGLTKNGKVVATGNNDSGQCNTSKWRDIVEISASSGMYVEYTVGLKSDGTLVAAGNNDFDQTNVGSITNIKIPPKPTYPFTNKSVNKKSSKAKNESNTVEEHVSPAEETQAVSQDEKSHSYTPFEVLYLPGSEPEKIRQKIERLKVKLDAAYPEKNISRLHIDHKKWGETVTELYKSLGYPDGDSFLTAYGYSVTKLSGGRPTSDHMAVIEELKRRYPNGSGVTTTTDLIAANPDLASRFSNLGNQAIKFFGMPLGEYLYSQGILNVNTNDKAKLPYEELKARYLGAPFDGTLSEMKIMNKDINWDDINRHHQLTNQAITLKNFLIEEGVMVSTKPSVDEKLDDVIAELKNRYSNGRPLPQSLDQLKAENSDLSLSQLNTWTELVYSEKANPFLIRNGLIEREKTSEEKHDLITSALKEKFGSDKSGANSIQIFIDELTVDQQEFVAKFFS